MSTERNEPTGDAMRIEATVTDPALCEATRCLADGRLDLAVAVLIAKVHDQQGVILEMARTINRFALALSRRGVLDLGPGRIEVVPLGGYRE